MLSCGDPIGGGNDIGRAACFLSFANEPDKVLLLTAMHVLVGIDNAARRPGHHPRRRHGRPADGMVRP